MPSLEEVFDDDTDIPLPDFPAPSSSRLIEQIDGDPDDSFIDMDRLRAQARAGEGANPGAFAPQPFVPTQNPTRDVGKRPEGAGQVGAGGVPMGGMMGDLMLQQQAEEARMKKLNEQMGSTRLVKDSDEYKNWFTLYPLYFDAKVSTTHGRRVPRSKSLWWPQSRQIASACSSLQVQCVHELEKTHPSDWRNPGRVKVQLQGHDGRFTNPAIQNRSQLYKRVAERLQRQNPSLAASDTPATSVPKASSTSSTPKPSASTSNKSKPKSTSNTAKAKRNVHPPMPQRKLPPFAPRPYPSLEDRLPINSPAVPLGFAVQSVKREMEQEKEKKANAIAAGGAGAGGGGTDQGLIGQGAKGSGKGDGKPKMKRMVVRR